MNKYIDMCREAVEIQQSWRSLEGDLWVFPEGTVWGDKYKHYVGRVFMNHHLGGDLVNFTYNTPYFSLFDILFYKIVWLPSQDQLQKIITDTLIKKQTQYSLKHNYNVSDFLDGITIQKFLVEEFSSFLNPFEDLRTMPHPIQVEEAEKKQKYINRFETMEELWLAFVMKKKYSKQWVEDKQEWEE